jgi:hypothetical protein
MSHYYSVLRHVSDRFVHHQVSMTLKRCTGIYCSMRQYFYALFMLFLLINFFSFCFLILSVRLYNNGVNMYITSIKLRVGKFNILMAEVVQKLCILLKLRKMHWIVHKR